MPYAPTLSWSNGGGNQGVGVVGHDHERMQEELTLSVIVKDRSLKQLRRGRDLKKAAAFSRHSGDQIGSGFLWSEPHPRSINERPAAKAGFFLGWLSGA